MAKEKQRAQAAQNIDTLTLPNGLQLGTLGGRCVAGKESMKKIRRSTRDSFIDECGIATITRPETPPLRSTTTTASLGRPQSSPSKLQNMSADEKRLETLRRWQFGAVNAPSLARPASSPVKKQSSGGTQSPWSRLSSLVLVDGIDDESTSLSVRLASPVIEASSRTPPITANKTAAATPAAKMTATMAATTTAAVRLGKVADDRALMLPFAATRRKAPSFLPALPTRGGRAGYVRRSLQKAMDAASHE